MSASPGIDIVNLQRRHRVNRILLRKVLTRAMRECGLNGTLSVAVVGPDAIAALNRRFLSRDGLTDVLSFPVKDARSGILGEIAICADAASAEASRRGVSFDSELALYAVHGLLHLAGYDDGTPGERARMRARERGIMDLFELRKRRGPGA